jgi:hypothetical protein
MRNAIVAVACLAVLPASAAAAGSDQQGTKPADPRPGVVVEKVENGFVGGPDVKYTQINGQDGVLVGGFGGMLTDKTLFIGGAAYWLANGNWDRELAYGGMLVQWHFFSRKAVNVNVGGLVGGGVGTVRYQWAGGDGWHPNPYPMPHHNHGDTDYYPPGSGPAAGSGVYESGFFVAEPQINVVWQAANWISLSAGVGYRAVAGAGDLNRELQGVTGSIAVRFGSSGR